MYLQKITTFTTSLLDEALAARTKYMGFVNDFKETNEVLTNIGTTKANNHITTKNIKNEKRCNNP
jgi:hypothetical protein